METSKTPIESPPQYLTDAEGNKIAVVLQLQTYQQLLDELDELRCQQGYQQAIEETEAEIQSGDYLTLDQYLNLDEKKA
ncbi:hypothetical protein [Lyngbya sp. CCY1209]|jgi:hypothetical protein|uniref:hypothetical protein n=1 Tax=Lyngbya sp. CCY1209 TaxID=2886103 RepID=UPI002D2146C1|nr:hypothetical protein [Lyngbya sp. CCY1209]MEB3882059.1 hypothetical protein [Lyngbya sp. CCY1209]